MSGIAKKVVVIGAVAAVLGWLAMEMRASAPQVPSNTWAATGDLAQQRAGASAVLLADGTVLVAGGVSDAGVTASVDRYSVASGAFFAASPMLSARANHSMTVLGDGRVLAAGGAGAPRLVTVVGHLCDFNSVDRRLNTTREDYKT